MYFIERIYPGSRPYFMRVQYSCYSLIFSAWSSPLSYSHSQSIFMPLSPSMHTQYGTNHTLNNLVNKVLMNAKRLKSSKVQTKQNKFLKKRGVFLQTGNIYRVRKYTLGLVYSSNSMQELKNFSYV